MRVQLDEEQVKSCLEQFEAALRTAISKKGSGIFVSSHEISGTLQEECSEFESAVHQNDLSHIRDELLDVAVTAIWGVGSIDSGKMDWPKPICECGVEAQHHELLCSHCHTHLEKPEPEA